MKRALVVVNEAVGELRREPAHTAEQVSQVILGAPLRVQGESDEGRWLQVAAPDGYRGWIRSWSVHPLSETAFARHSRGPQVEVDALVATVKARPLPRAEGIREVPLGVRLPRRGRAGKWFQVLLPDGEAGFLHSRDLLVDPNTLRPRRRARDLASVVRTAQRFLGVPYQWGGVTAKGLDCSGLTQTVFGLHGLELPRDAKDQFQWAARKTYVYRKPEEAQFGHLVFFGPSDHRVGHVGISLGNNKFLHARGRVRVNSLRSGDPEFEPTLRRQFLGACPVLLPTPA